MSRFLAPAAVSLALAVFAFAAPRALAAGPFDGNWVVDFPSADSSPAVGGTPGCPALRLEVQIQDGQLIARFQRQFPSNVVENSASPQAEPLQGQVAPDGTVAARWENYPITGRLGQDSGVVNVRGQCGPRTGHAMRMQ